MKIEGRGDAAKVTAKTGAMLRICRKVPGLLTLLGGPKIGDNAPDHWIKREASYCWGPFVCKGINRRRLLGGMAGAFGLAQAPMLMVSVAADEGDLQRIEELVPLATVYDDVRGHHVTGNILDHWLQHGRTRVFGRPISEPLTTDGKAMQFFEKGVLTEDPDSNEPTGVKALDLGQMWLDAQGEEPAPEAVDTRSAFWLWWTARGVNPDFWPKWLDEGGAFAWGYPITWGQTFNGQLTQTFQRARFVMTEDGPVADPLGEWLAGLRLIDTAPVERQAGILPYRADRFAPDYGPVEERRVDVDLTAQVANFYAGDQLVYMTLIAGGVPQSYTTPGTWRIFSRIVDERMQGGSEEDGDQYDLSNVYFTQYFTRSWIALHYAYWHDNFGKPQSHGCVNMRLDDSRWAWHFCDVNTRVVVHY